MDRFIPIRKALMDAFMRGDMEAYCSILTELKLMVKEAKKSPEWRPDPDSSKNKKTPALGRGQVERNRTDPPSEQALM